MLPRVRRRAPPPFRRCPRGGLGGGSAAAASAGARWQFLTSLRKDRIYANFLWSGVTTVPPQHYAALERVNALLGDAGKPVEGEEGAAAAAGAAVPYRALGIANVLRLWEALRHVLFLHACPVRSCSFHWAAGEQNRCPASSLSLEDVLLHTHAVATTKVGIFLHSMEKIFGEVGARARQTRPLGSILDATLAEDPNPPCVL